MFLINIPFKGCQGRLNHLSIVHAVSMTPHAPCMQCQWYCTHIKKFEYLREFKFIFEKALAS
jgi:hypothetical protein